MSISVKERFGISEYSTQRVELRRHWTEDDLQQVFHAAYNQVFGRIGVFVGKQFASAESLLRNGKVNVRQFVEILAKSDFYKERFFYNNSQGRFIELNYKHLLGRAPYDQSEIAYHVDLYAYQGYDAEIESYLYSPEYDNAFGNYVVPYHRGFNSIPGMKTVGFNRMFTIYRGDGNSDNAQYGGKNSRLRWNVSRNSSNTIVPPTTARSMGASREAGDATLLSSPTRGDNRLFQIEVVQGGLGTKVPVRRSKLVYTVAYDQLSSKYQEIHKSGGKIVNVVQVSAT
jgi:phycoerythrocyanin-associated rod linker protein